MLDPRNVSLSQAVFGSPMILIGIQDRYEYAGGKKTTNVCGVNALVMLSKHNYKRLTVKLPMETNIPEELMGKSVDFPGFVAKAYYIKDNSGKIRSGYNVNALGITLAKG